MSSIILTQAYMQGLNKGFNLTLRGALDAQVASAAGLAPLLLEETNAAGFASMEYDSLAGIPVLKKLTGIPQEKQNLSTTQFTVLNETFSRLLGLRREVLERGQAALYNKQIVNSAVAWYLFKEKSLAERLIGGFTVNDYTGSPFFSASRKIAEGKAGTIANLGTKKLSAVNFEAAVKNLRTRTDADGNILGLGSKMILVVSANNESTAKAIVAMPTLPSGAANPNYGSAELKVYPWLDTLNQDAWFLIDVAWIKPALLQTEVPLGSFMQTDPADSNVIINGEFLYQLYFRGNIVLSDPLAAWGSTGADPA